MDHPTRPNQLRCGFAGVALLLGIISAGSSAKAGLQTLHTFEARPLSPQGSLVQGADGDTYGTTQVGGRDQEGTVFKITATGEMVVLHSFTRSSNGGVDGGQPRTGLTLASDGNFYGTTVVGGTNGHGTIFRITPQGSLTTLYRFGSSSNETNPTALVQGNDGQLYGTTEGSGPDYPGTAFKLSPDGVYTRLYLFSGFGNGLDGGFPGPLMKAQDGNLYGLTASGGTHNHGTLFRLNLGGGVTPIYNFESSQGGGSRTRLVELSAGEFYGTSAGYGNLGSIYRITTSGVYTTLHSFTGGPDLIESEYLVVGSDGNLYGACPVGGSGGQPPSDAGIVFRITPSGVFDIIHSFSGGLDGRRPRCALVRTGEQTFRGITLEGGLYGAGTIFDVTAQGAFTTVVNFSDSSDGAGGSGAMVEGGDGSLYGATPVGGLFDRGTIFRITPEGEFTTLYNFQGDADGDYPGRLVTGKDGFFYGVARGGAGGVATLFKVSSAGEFTTVHNYVSDQEDGLRRLGLGKGTATSTQQWYTVAPLTTAQS